MDRHRAYGRPPPSVQIVQTAELLYEWSDLLNTPERRVLAVREESVVYEIGMTPGACRREDPYTGTQFIYDYNWCRSGPEPADKKRNLILHFPKIDRRRWYAANPNDDSRKSCNWYLTASALMFADGLDVLR